MEVLGRFGRLYGNIVNNLKMRSMYFVAPRLIVRPRYIPVCVGRGCWRW